MTRYGRTFLAGLLITSFFMNPVWAGTSCPSAKAEGVFQEQALAARFLTVHPSTWRGVGGFPFLGFLWQAHANVLMPRVDSSPSSKPDRVIGRFAHVLKLHREGAKQAALLRLSGGTGTAAITDIVVVRFRGHPIALMGLPKAGKSAIAKVWLGLSAEFELVAQRYGFLYFHHDRLSELFVRQFPEWDQTLFAIPAPPVEKVKRRVQPLRPKVATQERRVLATAEVTPVEAVIVVDTPVSRKPRGLATDIVETRPGTIERSSLATALFSTLRSLTPYRLELLAAIKQEDAMPLIHVHRSALQEEPVVFRDRALRLYQWLDRLFPATPPSSGPSGPAPLRQAA